MTDDYKEGPYSTGTLIERLEEMCCRGEDRGVLLSRGVWPDDVLEAIERIKQLEAALRDIMEDGIERKVGTYFRADNTPSKHDECEHGLAMYETCGNCIAEFARKALEGKDGT
jgi:hypothetical protein